MIAIEFGSPTCGPCRVMSGVLERVCSKHNIFLKKIDVNEDPGSAARYGVRALPTTIFMDNGRVLSSLMGLQTEAKVERVIAQAG